MNKLDKKIKILILFISIIITTVCLIILLFNHGENKTSNVQVDREKLIISYEANYCHLDFYKIEDKIIINAYSDGKFDEPNQLVIPYEGDITKYDILVKWKTLGGKVVEKDSNSIIIANIAIIKSDKIICDEDINLFEKGLKILNYIVGK